jgi:signal transduction histidine kinase/ActR/RegA family two-component response regulator
MARPGPRTLLGVGVVLAVALLVINAVLSVANTRRLAETDRRVRRTTAVLGGLERILSTLKDAETDLRGHLLTGRDDDLEAYDDAVASLDDDMGQFKTLLDDAEQQRWARDLESKVQETLAVMRETVTARRERGPEAAVGMILTGPGNRVRADIRRLVDRMEEDQHRLLDRQAAESQAGINRANAAVAIASGTALPVITLLYVVILHLLAARRQSEETLRDQLGRWRVTLSSIGDAVIVTDAAGRVTFLNQVAESLCGWAGEAAIRKPLTQVLRIFNEETRQPAEDPFAQVLREGTILGLAHPDQLAAVFQAGPGDRVGTTFGLTNHIVLIAQDGSERPICYNAAPIRDRTGDIIGVVLVFHDDTDRRRYEKELVDANRRKDEFLAMLAHELRNPLASIRSAVELFDMPGAGGHLDWAKEVIHRQVNHLAHLLDDLLDVSRINFGKIQLRKQLIDARPVIEHAIESVRLLMDDRTHQLEATVAPEALWLVADPIRLEQVLVNLLTNAARYTPPGGRIGLAAEHAGEQIVIRVTDTGMGIPPEVLPHIFDLFAQGRRSLARSEGGLGVGLTIVKKLVKLHGGSVLARSEGPGRGSEFTVRLPAAEPQPPEPTPPPAAPARRKGQKILIVDDNRDMARGLARLLTLLGHEVELAFDGPEGIASARAHRPEVVLLDIGLPHLDGYQVARRLRQEEGLVRALIIAISGYAQEDDRRRSREAGMDHHLAKPVDLKTIAGLIAQPHLVDPSEAVRPGNFVPS